MRYVRQISMVDVKAYAIAAMMDPYESLKLVLPGWRVCVSIINGRWLNHTRHGIELPNRIVNTVHSDNKIR